MSELHLHLVSDSTGETVSSVSRAAMAQFEGVETREHNWALIRSPSQMRKVMEAIEQTPGVVLYTLVDENLRTMLKEICTQLRLPCIPILGRVTREISEYIGVKTNAQPGKQHMLDDDYFSRMDAVNFALGHDDGQSHWDLEDADVILIGASRTSKTPTCIYLAYRGFKAANIPFVPEVPMPEILEKIKHTLIVGLVINAEHLVHIRRNRLMSMHEERETDYIDIDVVKDEIVLSRKYFSRHKWPVIDVTRKSVEETAANIIKLLQEHREKLHR